MNLNSEKEVLIKPVNKTSIIATIADLWQNRHLVSYFFIRSIQQRYKDTNLGWGWMIIRPLLPVFLSTMIFGNLAKLPSDDMPYLLFVFTGYSIWNLFSVSLIYMTRSIRMNRRLFTKLYFPRLIVPITSIAPSIIEFFVTFAMLFILAGIYFLKDGKNYLNFTPTFFMSGYFVFLGVLLTLGVGLWTSVMNAQSRDVRFSLPYLLQGWIFITPVIYPISFIPEKWRWLAYLNPMSVVVEGYKWSVLGRGEMHLNTFLLNTVCVVLVFLSGIWFFKKTETAFVDCL